MSKTIQVQLDALKQAVTRLLDVQDKQRRVEVSGLFSIDAQRLVANGRGLDQELKLARAEVQRLLRV